MVPDLITGWYDASSTFDQMKPVMKSTLSRFSISSDDLTPDIGFELVVAIHDRCRQPADLAAQHLQREIGRILHVLADDAGRSAQRGDETDFHLVIRQRRRCQQAQSGSNCQQT